MCFAKKGTRHIRCNKKLNIRNELKLIEQNEKPNITRNTIERKRSLQDELFCNVSFILLRSKWQAFQPISASFTFMYNVVVWFPFIFIAIYLVCLFFFSLYSVLSSTCIGMLTAFGARFSIGRPFKKHFL